MMLQLVQILLGVGFILLGISQLVFTDRLSMWFKKHGNTKMARLLLLVQFDRQAMVTSGVMEVIGGSILLLAGVIGR